MAPAATPPEYDVVFVAPWLGPRLSQTGDGASEALLGGAETQVFLLAKALAARAWRVAVLTYPTEAGLPDEVDGIAVIPQLRAKRRGDRLTAASTYLAYLNPFRQGLARVSAGSFVQRSMGVETALVGLVAKLKRRQFVYSSSSVIDFADRPALGSPTASRMFRMGLRLADAIVVQTAEQARLCSALVGRPPVVVKSIAEAAFQRVAQPETFLWIGRLASHKNPLAYVGLARALPEARFRMLAVPYLPEPQVGAEVQRACSLLPNLELLQPRPREALMPLVESAVAIVSTSDFEGMPNTFLEGWARGVPALALAHDPDSLIVKEGLGGFARGSGAELAALASEMWRSRDDQAAIAARCRRYVEREHSAQTAANCWEQVLGLSGATAT